jgi:hypothetical protein
VGPQEVFGAKLADSHGKPHNFVKNLLRTHLVAAVCLVLLLLAAAWLAMTATLHPNTSITRDDFHRIKLGMTAEDVMGILGPTGFRDTTVNSVYDPDAEPDTDDTLWTPGAQIDRRMHWQTDTAEVLVFLDKSGRVMQAGFSPRRVLTETNLSLLRKQWNYLTGNRPSRPVR